VIRSRISQLRLPHPIIVIPEFWPSALIPILKLRLPLAGAYFPSGLHHHFSPLCNTINKANWKPLRALDHLPPFKDDFIFVLSGSGSFIQKMWPRLGGSTQVITAFEPDLRRGKHALTNEAHGIRSVLTEKFKLQTATFRDAACGGATDARFLF